VNGRRLDRLAPNALPYFVFALLAATFTLRPNAVFNDGDPAWHIAAGDYIRESGAIPLRDPWSFTAGEQVWFNHSWLFDAAVSLLHQLGGLPLLYALSVFCYALIFAVLTQAAVRLGAGVFGVAAAMLFGGGMMASNLNLRPHMVTAVLAVAFYLVCARRDGSYRRLAWLPALMVVWVNCHSAFIVGFTVIGAFFLEAALKRDRQKAQAFFIAGAASLLAVFLNPHGFGLFTFIGATMNSVMTKEIGEWNAPDWANDLPRVFWLFLLAACWRWKKPFLSLADRTLVLFWAAMAIMSLRFWSVLLPLAAPHLAEIVTLRLKGKLKELDESCTQDMKTRGFRLTAFLTALLACGLVIYKSLCEKTPVHPKYYAAEAVEFLQKRYPGKRFLNHYNMGGALIWLGRGKPAVFMDSRAGAAYSEQVMTDYLALINHCKVTLETRRLFEAYKLDGVIYPAIPEFAETLQCWRKDTAFRSVYRDAEAEIFVRKERAR
jgi:preprotein translocase subunit SecG